MDLRPLTSPQKRPRTRMLVAALLALGAVVGGVGTHNAVAAGAAVTAAPSAPTAEEFDSYLAELREKTGAPGLSAVVTRHGEVVHAAGYGHDSDGAQVTAKTPMRVASVSKSFTAMAVMILVEDGRVELDGAVTDQLPELTMADPRIQDVTVRQLLDQTSGFSDRTIDVVDLDDATSLTDYVSRLADDGIATRPGTAFSYCNVNLNVAARLVEVASGQPFDVFMAERVFEPLGMSHSATHDDGDVRPSRGYNSLYGWWIPRAEAHGFLDDAGSGGIITSAADMGRWLISQNGYGPQLVPQQRLTQMHTPSDVHEYGMGWGIEDDGSLAHSGNLMTYNAVEWIDPRTGYGVAVLSGAAGMTDITWTAMEGLRAMIRGETPVPPAGGHTVDLALGGVALAALALGGVGLARARRWAQRRTASGTRRSRWTAWVRTVWLLGPAALFLLYPTVVSVLSNGRTVTWPSVMYFALPLTLTLAAIALAGLTVAVGRIVQLERARSVGSTT